MLANGLLDDTVLTLTSGGRKLYTPAALGYERLAAAFKARFGKPLMFGSGWTGYRTLAQQQTLYNQLGYPKAAIPGTSNHGLGLAGDFGSGIDTYNSAEWKWMNTVGRTYGWSPLNESNLTFEPWHWVYSVAKDQHYNGTTPPEDDDMPLNDTDKKWIHDEIVASVVRGAELLQNIQNAAGTGVWSHEITRGGLGPAAAEDWLGDTRVIVGQIASAPAAAVDLDALAKAIVAKLPQTTGATPEQVTAIVKDVLNKAQF